MSTTTLGDVLLDPELARKAEKEVRKLSSEAAAEVEKNIEALNESLKNGTASKPDATASSQRRATDAARVNRFPAALCCETDF